MGTYGAPSYAYAKVRDFIDNKDGTYTAYVEIWDREHYLEGDPNYKGQEWGSEEIFKIMKTKVKKVNTGDKERYIMLEYLLDKQVK